MTLYCMTKTEHFKFLYLSLYLYLGFVFWPNGQAHWISCEILSGKMVSHFVVRPKLIILDFCILYFVFVFGIGIWPNGHVHWIDGEICSGKMVRHFIVGPKLNILCLGPLGPLVTWGLGGQGLKLACQCHLKKVCSISVPQTV